MIKEIWKSIEGYDGAYEISNLGKCRTYRIVGSTIGRCSEIPRIINPVKCTNGYLEYQLAKKGKRKCYMAHRLVAQAFIPNPLNKNEVNHKDEDITNNVVTNLEWVTSKENANYGTRNKRVARKNSIKVVQMDLEGKIIKIWDSFMDVERTLKIDCSSVIRVCKGKQNTSIGYKWMYYKDYINISE